MSPVGAQLGLSDVEAQIDRMLIGIPSFSGAEELKLSPLLPRSSVLATHYVRSFPQHALVVSGAMGSDSEFLLAPTTCYAVFDHLRDRQLSSPSLFTHKNLCFRNEETYRPGERQSSFLMREFIFLSTDLGLVHEWIGHIVRDVPSSLAEEFWVDAVVKKASDPFFDPKDLHLKFQESENLKSEFVVDGLAVASVNLHLGAFARSCNLRSNDGQPLYSACFGLGYDRLVAKSTAARADVQSPAGDGRKTSG
ncbi:hypothetical protein AB0K35_02310 [Micromonospora sp. NPDC053740]|uniref:hypothetical protein n=1 Tax=Micromonospora TaxID=1873 RepID=UPI001EE78E1C|nr:hypothetical protein [Micromonospora alfalfae]MCG5461606.1 hypothetical protein [Micromonospora alfalfae]